MINSPDLNPDGGSRAWRKRPLLIAGGVVLVLTSIVALSSVSRRPYFHTGTATWHASKVSRMTEAGGARTSVVRNQESTEAPPQVRSTKLSFLPYDLHLAKLPALLPSQHFRAPPNA